MRLLCTETCRIGKTLFRAGKPYNLPANPNPRRFVKDPGGEMITTSVKSSIRDIGLTEDEFDLIMQQREAPKEKEQEKEEVPKKPAKKK